MSVIIVDSGHGLRKRAERLNEAKPGRLATPSRCRIRPGSPLVPPAATLYPSASVWRGRW